MNSRNQLLILRAAVGLSLILFAILIAGLLVRFARAPDQVTPPENTLAVRLMPAESGSATATLSAHGMVRPLRETRISAEVSGLLLTQPHTFRRGDLVEKDQILAQIDPRDAESALSDARAGLAQARSALSMLNAQEETDRERRAFAHRAKELAEAEFRRNQRLFDEQEIGSVSLVEASEQAFTQAATQLALLDQALALYPSRREEAEARITAAESRVRQSELRLERTEIRAPFAGRLTHAATEPGEQVQPGQVLFHLADDRTLEVIVPLEASEVRNWMQFKEDAPVESAWFPTPEAVPATLTWAEAGRELSWTGTLHRIVDFDSTARTVKVAVRIDAALARSADHPIPLAAGMFCRVELPGRTLDDVYILPRSAVTFDAKVHLADENDRLRTVSVEILRAQRDDIIVSGGIQSGDRIITTRLIAPLEGTLLDIQED
jgi:RND family efflux transporter MFP subunit